MVWKTSCCNFLFPAGFPAREYSASGLGFKCPEISEFRASAGTFEPLLYKPGNTEYAGWDIGRIQLEYKIRSLETVKNRQTLQKRTRFFHCTGKLAWEAQVKGELLLLFLFLNVFDLLMFQYLTVYCAVC